MEEEVEDEYDNTYDTEMKSANSNALKFDDEDQ
jgi:hypothetical protein